MQAPPNASAPPASNGGQNNQNPISVGPEALRSSSAEVAAALKSKDIPAETQDAVAVIRQVMGENPQDPRDVFIKAEPFRKYKEKHRPASDAEVNDNLNDMMDQHIGTARYPNGEKDHSQFTRGQHDRYEQAAVARDYINDLLNGEIVSDPLFEDVADVLFDQWPAFQDVYGSIEDVRDLEDDEMQIAFVQDIQAMIANPDFKKQLLAVYEARKAQFGSEEAIEKRQRLEDNIVQADQRVKAAASEVDATSKRVANLRKDAARLQEFQVGANGMRGSALEYLEVTYPENAYNRDKLRLSYAQQSITQSERRMLRLEDEIAMLDSATQQALIDQKEKERDGIETMILKRQQQYQELNANIAKREALVRERDGLIRRQDSFNVDAIKAAEAEVEGKKAQKASAEKSKTAAEKALAQAEQAFVEALQSVPEEAVSAYMSERLDKIAQAREEVLKRIKDESPDAAVKAIQEGLLYRWGKYSSERIRDDFNDVIAEGNAESLVIDIIAENVDEIPLLRDSVAQAEQDVEAAARARYGIPAHKHFDDLTERQQDLINQARQDARKVVVEEWYTKETTEDWRIDQERQVLLELYDQRKYNCKEWKVYFKERLKFGKGWLGSRGKDANGEEQYISIDLPEQGDWIRVPIPEHQNQQFLEILGDYEGGEDGEEQLAEDLEEAIEEYPATKGTQKALEAAKKKAEKEGLKLYDWLKKNKSGLLASILVYFYSEVMNAIPGAK